MRNWGREGMSVSGTAFCHRFMPSFAFLSRRFVSARVRHCCSVAALCLGAYPALRFCRGALPRFTPAVCLAPNRTACGILRSYSAGSRSPFVRSRGALRLSALAGSLRVCAFLYGDLDGVIGDAGNEERGTGERGWRRGLCALLRNRISIVVLSAGSTLGLRAPNLRQRVFDSLDSLHAAAGLPWCVFAV